MHKPVLHSTNWNCTLCSVWDYLQHDRPKNKTASTDLQTVPRLPSAKRLWKSQIPFRLLRPLPNIWATHAAASGNNTPMKWISDRAEKFLREKATRRRGANKRVLLVRTRSLKRERMSWERIPRKDSELFLEIVMRRGIFEKPKKSHWTCTVMLQETGGERHAALWTQDPNCRN